MADDCSCTTGGKTKLVFSCSGAADVGELSDRVARRLGRQGSGKMYCLAGLGGEVSGIIATTKEASKILVIDGCPVDCGKKTMERLGFKEFAYIRVTDLGFQKGKSTVDDGAVDVIVQEGAKLLAC